jgi:RNA polymerase sigma factor (sigma-70 family)
MTSYPLGPIVRRLRDLAEPMAGERPTDAELLRRFAERRDPAAFELLVWRYAALVWGTCRRALRRSADAEDAFQAAFLLLLRKAGAIRRADALPGWLHRVSLRVALRARAAAARRARHEQPDPAAVESAPGREHDPSAGTADLRRLLDGEIDRLPAKLRAAVVLCYLDGHTTDEAARRLGCPRGTVLSRLAAARERLRRRLVARGVAPALAAAVLAGGSAGSAPPPMLVAETASALLRAAAGGTAVAPPVLNLADGVTRAMTLTKLRWVAVAVLGAGLVAAGPGWLLTGPGLGGAPALAAAEAQPPANPLRPAPPQDKKEADEQRQFQEAKLAELIQERMNALLIQEERSSEELVRARLAVAQCQDRLKAVEPGLARQALDPEIQDAGKELRKLDQEAHELTQTKGPNHPDFQKVRERILAGRSRLEQSHAKADRLEAEAAEVRPRAREELFRAEENLRQLERRTELRRRFATADVEAAHQRLRRLQESSLPDGRSAPSLSEIDRKLDAIQRELGELRRGRPGGE